MKKKRKKKKTKTPPTALKIHWEQKADDISDVIVASISNQIDFFQPCLLTGSRKMLKEPSGNLSKSFQSQKSLRNPSKNPEESSKIANQSFRILNGQVRLS